VFQIWHVWTGFGRNLQQWVVSIPVSIIQSTLCRCCLTVSAAVQPTPQHTLSCLHIDWSKLQLNFVVLRAESGTAWREDWTDLWMANGSVSSHRHKQTQTHIQTHTHIETHKLRHKSTLTRTHNHTLTHTETHQDTRARSCTHTLKRTHKHTHTHTTHIHTHNTYSHTQHTYNTHTLTNPNSHTRNKTYTHIKHTQTHTHTQQTLTLTHSHTHNTYTHNTYTHATHTTHTHSDRSTSAPDTPNTCTPTPIATAAHAARHQQVITAVMFCILVPLSARLNLRWYSKPPHRNFRGPSQSVHANYAPHSAAFHSPPLPSLHLPITLSLTPQNLIWRAASFRQGSLSPPAKQNEDYSCWCKYNNI